MDPFACLRLFDANRPDDRIICDPTLRAAVTAAALPDPLQYSRWHGAQFAAG